MYNRADRTGQATAVRSRLSVAFCSLPKTKQRKVAGPRAKPAEEQDLTAERGAHEKKVRVQKQSAGNTHPAQHPT